MPDYIKVDIEKYRKDRQLENINLVFEHIYKAHKTIESSDSVNINALQRVYEYIGREEVIQKVRHIEETMPNKLYLKKLPSDTRTM